YIRVSLPASLATFLFECPAVHTVLPAFPTRRSSDLGNAVQVFFRDGSSTDRVSIDYPIGHRKRRDEGIPVLLAKFEAAVRAHLRSEEHTSELQSRENLVCRLLLEKKTISKGQNGATL